MLDVLYAEKRYPDCNNNSRNQFTRKSYYPVKLEIPRQNYLQLDSIRTGEIRDQIFAYKCNKAV